MDNYAIAHSADDADRALVLAVRSETYNDVFVDQQMQGLLKSWPFHLIVVDVTSEEIVQWIK